MLTNVSTMYLGSGPSWKYENIISSLYVDYRVHTNTLSVLTISGKHVFHCSFLTAQRRKDDALSVKEHVLMARDS